MKAHYGTLGLALVLIGLPALAAAQSRERSGGSGSAAVGARHHSGGSSQGAVARGSAGRSYGQGQGAVARGSAGRSYGQGQGAVARGSAGRSYEQGQGAVPRGSAGSASHGAQARHPRAGTGTGWYRGGYYGGHYPYYGGYYGYGYGYPYWGYGWGYPYSWGIGYGYPSYGYGDGYGQPYAYEGRAIGSLRVIVEPADTRVYVDGYYAGTADDFDGMFQRLNVAPGRHEIMLKKEGFKGHRFQIYAAADQTLKLKYTMQHGEGEDPAEDLTGSRVAEEEPRYDLNRDLRERDRAPREPERSGFEVSREPEMGYLRLDVRPGDATVYVDGEFRGSARQADRLDLPPGRHRVEVVRPGYRTVEREIEVRPGRNESIAIDLERS